VSRLVLFDDARARRWAPFASTRPVGELRYGSLLLRERVEEAMGLACALHLAGPALTGWDEPGAPPVRGVADAGVEDARLLWNSRAVPHAPVELPADGPATFMVDGQVAGWLVPAGAPAPTDDMLTDLAGGAAGPGLDLPGEWLDWPWTLVERNPVRLALDLEARWADRDHGPVPGVVRVGAGPLSLGAGAVIEGGVTVDTREGPVRLEAGVRVEGPARLVGPLHLGRGCVVFGGSLARLSAGPVCKLRGEIDGCVLIGFANKAHDGYLGHALVGRWVNLGAMTTNSDLKNSYSPVRVELPDGTEDTGLLKVGVFLGDHVKTGIGTLLTTGAVVGAGSNLFGGGTPPRHVPAFSWGGADALAPYELERFLATTSTAMARRGESLTSGVTGVLSAAWRRVHGPA
jgi:UDP-N-acetylglucosamine diphosphorylase / glucose-1-phosphate thymidylyltransferase / UDP-N-acetylgalactosamine diphosphorylase / glucosamine-1-phosphate N-acetyltransferase / galactosamine-1-phosphate N-acetyltransferase